MRRVAGYQMRDVARSRWLIAYALFFLVLTDALFRFGGGGSRALLSLVDVVLFIVPLVTIVFGTMYLYNAREFVELILAQPVRRRAVFGGLYAGLVGPLVLGFVAGVAIPFAVHGATDAAGTLVAVLGIGTLLTLVFGAIALLIAVRADDRLKGLGVAIGVWLLTAVVYDGVVLLLVSTFADYPLERPMLGALLAAAGGQTERGKRTGHEQEAPGDGSRCHVVPREGEIGPAYQKSLRAKARAASPRGATTQSSSAPTAIPVPRALPKNCWKTAPVYPSSAATSKRRSRTTRARSTGLASIAPSMGRSRG
jgi:Cu-processing system permease protein